jgi:hypothetical protein
MEFAIAGAVVIVLLGVLGILFLPRRDEVKQEEQLLSLYPETRDRRGVRAVGRESRSDGERNASRSDESAAEHGEDGQVGVERDPI